MSAEKSELRSILMDVRYEGAAVINKKKLLHLVGAKYDKPWVWQTIVAEWKALGFPKADLQGVEVHDNICLLAPTGCSVEKLTKWAA